MRAVVSFLATRLARALVAVWLVSTVVFVVMRLSGDPVPLLLPPDAPRSEYARVARELGIDRPLPVQYAVFLGVFGLIFPGVDNWAHAGGFAGGFLASLVLDPLSRERTDHMIAAFVCLGLTVAALIASFITALPYLMQ